MSMSKVKVKKTKERPIHEIINDKKGHELVKHFALGILFILLALVAIEALAHVAPNLYGDAKASIKQYGIPGVFVGVFLGSTILPFPTDLFYTTAVNLSETLLDKTIVVTVAVLAAFLATLLNYGLARILRDKLVGRFVDKKQLEEAKEWFDKYGPWPIVLLGIIPAAPVFDPLTFAAGLTGMDAKKFAIYSLLSRILHFAGIALLASYFTI